MKKAPLVLMALNGLAWGCLSWMGWNGIKYIESQHATGYPNTGQIGYYLAAPLVMLTLSLVPAALFGQTKMVGSSNPLVQPHAVSCTCVLVSLRRRHLTQLLPWVCQKQYRQR